MSRLPLLIGLWLAVSTVHAQEDSGPYLGFSFGSFDYEHEIIGRVISDTTSVYRLFGGYRFSENFALEGGRGATSDLKDGTAAFVPGLGNVTFDVQGDYEVLTVRALGIVPFEKVSLFGGVGYYDADITASARYQDAFSVLAGTPEDSDSGATLIGGLQFDLERVSIRGEYEWFDTDSSIEAWDVSIGLLFRF